MSNRAQFLEERKTGIGGSDVADLFSLPPYGCARKLYYDKTDVAPDYPVVESGPMRRGRRFESLIAEFYAQEANRFLSESPMARHPESPWAIVHVDRLVSDHGNGNYDRVLEIKSLGREMFYRVKRDGMPDAYILQVQHGMFVTRKETGAFAVYWAEQDRLAHWDVERDGDIIASIQDEGNRFWRAVEAKDIPDRLDAKSPQCQRCPWRTTCQGEAMLASVKDTVDVALDVSLAALVSEYADAKQLSGEAEDLLQGVKERLQIALGDRPAVDVPGFRVYFRPQETVRLNDGKVRAFLEWALARLADLESRLNIRVDYDGTMICPEIRYHQSINDLKAVSVSRPLRLYAK